MTAPADVRGQRRSDVDQTDGAGGDRRQLGQPTVQTGKGQGIQRGRFKSSAWRADNVIVRRRRLSLPNVPRNWRLVTPLAVAFLLGPGAASAAAKAFLPPPGKVFQGEAGQPISSYVRAAGKHPAVY